MRNSLLAMDFSAGMDSGNEGDDAFPALDEFFAILSDTRRRHILQCLIDHGPQVSLPDLADEVSIRTHECPITDISEETVLEIYISLYHQHVPKLAEAGVVQYDQERDLVKLAVDEDAILRALPENLLDSRQRE